MSGHPCQFHSSEICVLTPYIAFAYPYLDHIPGAISSFQAESFRPDGYQNLSYPAHSRRVFASVSRKSTSRQSSQGERGMVLVRHHN
jgi:hypothetical protein